MTMKPIDILVVEDNDDDVVLIQEAFSEGKMVNRIAVVRDGEEAMVYLHRQGPYAAAPLPGMILLDINMPKKNGIEATARIKARWPETVVIGLSVQAGEEARRAILNAGGAVLLTKEAAVDELYRTIREVLDGDGKGMAEVR